MKYKKLNVSDRVADKLMSIRQWKDQLDGLSEMLNLYSKCASFNVSINHIGHNVNGKLPRKLVEAMMQAGCDFINEHIVQINSDLGNE